MERFLCRKPSTTAVGPPPWFQNRLNISARVGLWDTALKFLSPGPRNDVTDHLDTIAQLLPARRLCLFVFSVWLFEGKSKYITKKLMYGPEGNS